MGCDLEKMMALRALLADPFRDVPELTDRERECARMFAKGQAVTAIARKLGISRAATYGHMNGAAAKIAIALGMKSSFRAKDLPALAWMRLVAEAAA